MIDIKNKADCSGCGACKGVCPVGAIELKQDSEDFLYPKVDTEKCVSCRLCLNRCPVISKAEVDESREPVAFAAKTRDIQTLLSSSSGGIFGELAKFVLNNGGVVFGAAYDEALCVKHTYIDTKVELRKLQGSKYVQSKVGNAYDDAKKFLDEGRMVLFTGTPCQIAGLYSFLNKPYENLITQDIICHGVPSPMVWKNYIKGREAISGSKVSQVDFRCKRLGWKKYSLRLGFENETEYVMFHGEDLFFKCFLNNICLRPSCYSCAFKNKKRQSDITLADFWGIENVCRDFDSDNGASLVIVNSKKGLTLFENIFEKIIYQYVDFEQAIKNNTAMISSVSMNAKRNRFMEKVKESSIFEAEKYLKKSIAQKIKSKAISILKKYTSLK